MVVPPHQLTQDSAVLLFHVSALLTLDLAVQFVMFKVEQHLRIIESFPAKAEGAIMSPDSSSCWLTHPALHSSLITVCHVFC